MLVVVVFFPQSCPFFLFFFFFSPTTGIRPPISTIYFSTVAATTPSRATESALSSLPVPPPVFVPASSPTSFIASLAVAAAPSQRPRAAPVRTIGHQVWWLFLFVLLEWVLLLMLFSNDMSQANRRGPCTGVKKGPRGPTVPTSLTRIGRYNNFVSCLQSLPRHGNLVLIWSLT